VHESASVSERIGVDDTGSTRIAPDVLRSYQQLGVAFLLDSPAALLADEMGLGKTVQVLTAFDRYRRSSGTLRALVVAPASVKTNWLREAQRWAPGATARLVQGGREDRLAWYDLPVHILIASYDQVRLDFYVQPPATEFDVVVLDEAQRVKDPAAATTVAVARIPRRRTWALTATPLENRAKDLETIIRLLRPGSLYENPSLPEIHEVLQGIFLRRRKKDVLPELPPIIDESLRIDLLPQQRAVYEDVWRGRGTYADSVTHVLALITKLKQLCNFDPESNVSGKLDALLDIVDAVRDEKGKLLIFSQYVETLRWLATRLPLPLNLIHGDMPIDERQAALDHFEEADEAVACLVSLRAGGVGLNIPTASHVVLYDRWWNPALEDQAVHRAHRFGRRDPLLVFRFLVSDTVEERINDVLMAKRDLFEQYVDDAPSRDSFTLSELRSILDLDSIDVGGDAKEIQ
jgi:SNF2 family DNA or RNA helicase